MKTPIPTVADVEVTLRYLLGVISLARNGDQQGLKEGAFDYAHALVVAAELSLKQINLFDITRQVIGDAERLLQAGQFDAADKLLSNLNRDMLEKLRLSNQPQKPAQPAISESESDETPSFSLNEALGSNLA